MPLQSRATGAIWCDSLGSDWRSHTFEVTFAPKAASASVAMCQLYGDPGIGAIGIRLFEYRDSPSGPNKKKDFGKFFWNWPPSVYHELMTSVTFAVSVFDESSCLGSWTLDFWS